MARFQLDFNKVEERSFPIYPPGGYVLRVADIKQEAAKSSGELKLTVRYEIVSGPNGGPEFAGKTVIASYSLQQQAAFRLVKFLGACGIPPEQMGGVDDQQLVGIQLMATLSVENYQGRQLNRVGDEQMLQQHGAPAAAPQFQAPAPQGFAAPAPYVPAPQPPMPQQAPPQGFAPALQGHTPPPGYAPAPGYAPPPAWGGGVPQPGGGIPAGFNGAAPPPPPKPIG